MEIEQNIKRLNTAKLFGGGEAVSCFAVKILLCHAYDVPEAMSMEQSVNHRLHTLTLEGRSRARLTGVDTVCCFHEREIVLETSEGEIALLGEGLHIEQLNLEEVSWTLRGKSWAWNTMVR